MFPSYKRSNRVYASLSIIRNDFSCSQFDAFSVGLSPKLTIQPLNGSFVAIAEFWLPDKRKTDLSNKWESLADCLVKAEILPDDNCEILPDIRLIYRGVDRKDPKVILNFERLD